MPEGWVVSESERTSAANTRIILEHLSGGVSMKRRKRRRGKKMGEKEEKKEE